MWEKASSRALYTVDIWDGPAIRLCFTKYDIYFECREEGEKGKFLKTAFMSQGVRNERKYLHRPGIEPGPPAWQASILPLNQRCSQCI